MAVIGKIREGVEMVPTFARNRSTLATTARLALIGCAGLVGCSKADHPAATPVRGQVSLNGQPASGGFVVFHPVGPSAKVDSINSTAKVEADGSFRLTTWDDFDGAPPGDYAVTVRWNRLVVLKQEATAGPNVIPAAYDDPNRTPIRVSVGEAPLDLPPIAIKR